MLLGQSRLCIHLRKKSQSQGARGMATLKAISVRLKSVKNIQKITQSMKMVSAAKFTRAEKDLKQAKVLGEGLKTFYTNAELDKAEEEMPAAEAPKNEIYIAVSSDRGLSGAIHSSVAKIMRKEIEKDGENVKVVCIGDKARSLLHRGYGEKFLFVCQEVGRTSPTFLEASKIANEILHSEFEFDSGKIVFNRFRSVVSYVTEKIPFYSFHSVVKSPKIQTYDDPSEDSNDDSNEETLQSFMEFSFAALLFYAMKEGACSEQASRMTAMDNASKNAGDMISKLTLSFNRTRQAVITRELIEIISGASAL